MAVVAVVIVEWYQLLLLFAVGHVSSVLAAGQARHPDTYQTVDDWAGEITKKWSSLVAQKQKPAGSKPQAPTIVPMQEEEEGIIRSQDGSLTSQALDFSSSGDSSGR